MKSRLWTKAGGPQVDIDEATNSFSISGTAHELARAAELLKELDRPFTASDLTAAQVWVLLEAGPSRGESQGIDIHTGLVIHAQDGRLHLEIDGKDGVVDITNIQVRFTPSGERSSVITAPRIALSLLDARGKGQWLYLDAPDGVLRISDDNGKSLASVRGKRVVLRHYSNEFEFERLEIPAPIPPQASPLAGNFPSGRAVLPPIFTTQPTGVTLRSEPERMQPDKPRIQIEAKFLTFSYETGTHIWDELTIKTRHRGDGGLTASAADLEWLLLKQQQDKGSSSVEMPRLIAWNDSDLSLNVRGRSIVKLLPDFDEKRSQLVDVSSRCEATFHPVISEDRRSLSLSIRGRMSSIDEDAESIIEKAITVESVEKVPNSGILVLRCDSVLNRIVGTRRYRRRPNEAMAQTAASELAREPILNAPTGEFVILIVRPTILSAG